MIKPRNLVRWLGGIGLLGVVSTTSLARPASPPPLPAIAQTPPPSVATASALVFDGVTVVDVEQGKLLPGQRVVVKDNHITAVGPATSVPLPAGAQVIDARGKYLIPGLWDLHMHAWGSYDEVSLGYGLLLANGMTGFRDPGMVLPLDTAVRWRREILAGTRIGPPRQLFAGPVINGPCRGENPGDICVADTAAARHLVDSLKAAGADMVKTYNLSADLYFVIAAEARRVGLLIGGHTTNVPPLVAADSGMRIADHAQMPNISGALDSLCFHPRTATVAGCGPVAARWRETNSWSVPTLLTMAPAGLIGDPSESPFPGSIGQLETAAVMAFIGGKAYQAGWRQGAVPYPPAHDSSAQYPLPSLRIAARVGLPIAAGTDATPTRAGFDLHAELALFVERGLTPLAALQAGTLNPAKLLQAMDSLGTVATGKLADLVLLDANPLENIANTTTIRAVVANGRYFDRVALDDLIARFQKRVNAAP